MSTRTAGWVLVGGESRRMGRDKALLQIDAGHQSLALRAAEQLSLVAETVTLVGDPTKYSFLGFPVAPDLRPGCGPLAGLEAALSATTADWNVIVACDLPAIDRAFFMQLLELTDGIDAVVPRHADGKIEPLCALYHRRALTVIRNALESGTRRVTDAIASLTLRYLSVADERAFRNLNTPEDVARYRDG